MKNKGNKVNEMEFNEIIQPLPSLSGWRNQDIGQISLNTFRASVSKQKNLSNNYEFSFSPVKMNTNFPEIPFSISRSNLTPFVSLKFNSNKKFFKKKKETPSPLSKLKKTPLKQKLASLNNVCNILEQIFTGKIVHFDQYNLKAHESRLIYCVMRLSFVKMFKHYERTRKPQKIAEIRNIRNYLDNKRISEICSDTLRSDFFLVKRKEENLKFIMKNTIKFFRKQFFKNYGYKASIEYEKEFLDFYFANHVQKYKEPVDVFSDPLNNTLITNPTYKTLSNEYLAKVFDIDKFKNVFFFHLDNTFKKSYQKSIFKKFRKMFKKLKLKLEVNDIEKHEQLFFDFIESLKKKRFAKLPWHDKEIDNAVITFKKHVEKILKEHRESGFN